MALQWNILQADETKVNALQKALGINRKICELLVLRDIDTYEKAFEFFRPNINHLHDPFLMNDMEAAVIRIEQAIKNNEHILILGDYDVDGTTSVALMYSFFKEFYSNISYYIPNRYLEGYGVSMKAIEYAISYDCELIICLDMGVTAVEQVAYAKSKGIDFIICDHHRPSDILPDAVALLNPKRIDNTYPYDELSGCGIGFKLIQAYAQKNNMDFSTVEKQLDLVVISIASDIVPITGENRILSYFGLKKINTNPRISIKALMDVCKIVGEMNINSLVFVLGPRINAAGRIHEGNDAVKLLTADNLETAYEQAQLLQSQNTERKDFDKSITESAMQMLDTNPDLQNKYTTVLANDGWHKGVIGIVASRLIEKYYRPTIIISKNNGAMVGSVRSVKNFDVYEALTQCSYLLDKFGGHKYAAGVSLKSENFEAFANRFEEVVSKTIKNEDRVPRLTIDAALDAADITTSFYALLKQFAPFGPGNMTPLFVSNNLFDTGASRLLNDKHLKLFLKTNTGQSVSGIGFEMPQYYDIVKSGKPISVVYSLSENEWQGRTTIETRIRDINFTN